MDNNSRSAINRRYILGSFTIVLFGIIAFSCFNSNKPSELDTVKLKENVGYDRKNLSILQFNESTNEYEKYTGEGFPDNNYYSFNATDSGCLNTNGTKIEGALTYANNKVIITTRETVQCYLYFDISKYSLTFTVGSNIQNVQYRLNNTGDYTTITSTTTIPNLNYGTSYEYFGVPSNTYIINCNESNKCSGTVTSDTNIDVSTTPRYNLILTVDSTSISKIYYKVNGATTWSNTTTNTTIPVNENTNFYVYAEPKTDYAYSEYNSDTNYYTGTMKSSGYEYKPIGTEIITEITKFYLGNTEEETSTAGSTASFHIEYSGKINSYCISTISTSCNGTWTAYTDSSPIEGTVTGLKTACSPGNSNTRYAFIKNAKNNQVIGPVEDSINAFHCFDPETEVDVWDRKRRRKIKKKIKDIKPGDYVYSYDETTDKCATVKVKKVHINKTKEICHIFVNGENIKTTRLHSFYVKNLGYINAEDLKEGMELAAGNKIYYKIEKIEYETLSKERDMYSLELEEGKSYAVSKSSIINLATFALTTAFVANEIKKIPVALAIVSDCRD